jgi:pyruvate kinase
MLESMISAPAPTRAEASDVATAVYQGADAVMLSAESAVGRHPQTAVAMMDRLIRAVEDDPDHWSRLFDRSQRTETTLADAISHSARDIAELLDCQAILAFTKTGSTAIRVSRERPHCKVLGLTPNLQTARQLSLAWGLHSVVTDDISSFQEMVARADIISRQEAGLEQGDLVIVTAGIPFGRPGTTNTLKIMRIGES